MNPNGSVTLDQPPNNKLFDPSQLTRVSPVVQCRKAEQAAATASSSSSSNGQPIFNITLGSEFANILRPAPAPILAQPPPPAALQPRDAPQYPSLIPPTREPGIDMPLPDFCAQYGFSTSVLNKLTTNGFICTRSLRFIQTVDLGTIGFLLGEVVKMKDAVKQWAVPSLQ
jgi:hypothetical protein